MAASVGRGAAHPLDDPTNGFCDNCATSIVLLFVTSFLTVGSQHLLQSIGAIPSHFWVLFTPPWLLCVAFGNAVVLWRHLHVVGRSRLAYTPSLVVQVVQIIIYPAYSAAFEAEGCAAKSRSFSSSRFSNSD
jgi:hypothetical protein